MGQILESSQVSAFLKEIDHDPSFKNASLGICVMKESTGEIILDHHASKSLVPRSIIKLVTTAAILKELGKNYRFKTKLLMRGEIKEHTLHGDLVIKGSGDPSLGSSRFTSQNGLLNKWAKEVKKLGITKITGSIIADASCFEKSLTPPTWQYEDIGNYYGVGASGLNYNENFYQITFSLGKKVGALTKILSLSPSIQGLNIVNEVTEGEKGSGDQAYVFGNEFNYNQTIRGTVPTGKTTFAIKAAVPDPAKLLAEQFSQALSLEGITAQSGAVSLYEEQDMDDLSIISEKKSDTLLDLITKTHHLSINVYTECFVKKLGKGSLNLGLLKLESFCSSIGMDIAGVRFADGSGLSLNNLVTPKSMCEFLRNIRKEPYFDIWKGSLTEFTKDTKGSMLSYFNSSKFYHRVFAKTGTAKNEKSIMGYLDTENHGRVIFCVICNHYLSSLSSFREKMRSLFSLALTDSSFSNLSVTSSR